MTYAALPGNEIFRNDWGTSIQLHIPKGDKTVCETYRGINQGDTVSKIARILDCFATVRSPH